MGPGWSADLRRHGRAVRRRVRARSPALAVAVCAAALAHRHAGPSAHLQQASDHAPTPRAPIRETAAAGVVLSRMRVHVAVQDAPVVSRRSLGELFMAKSSGKVTIKK